MATLDVTAVLKQFDQLKSEGELFWTPTRPVRIQHSGLDFEFRTIPSFNRKPNLSYPEETAQSARRPPPSDGSDIDHADPAFFVAYAPLNTASISNSSSSDTESAQPPPHATHKLILNKFAAHRPQYLLLTLSPHSSQSTSLDATDMAAAWNVLSAVTSPQYIVFNCGVAAGSSRRHKHMQMLGMPELEDPESCHGGRRARRLMWPHVDVLAQTAEKLDKVPYLHFFKRIGVDEGPEEISSWYEEKIRRCRDVTGRVEGDLVAHNFVMTREWCMVIPRRAATVEGIEGHLVGAQGMLGLLWIGKEEQAVGWKRSGMGDVLIKLGLPWR